MYLLKLFASTTKSHELKMRHFKYVRLLDVTNVALFCHKFTTMPAKLKQEPSLRPNLRVLAKLISGWEHVFLGEYRLDRQEEIVDGQHYWVRYYLEEKTGHINYHGYHAYDEGLLATIQYTWNGYLKKVGGFLLRSSPGKFRVCVMSLHTDLTLIAHDLLS
ncbi:endoribonuclease xendoU domain-containing protein [Ditylenchus destructor]|uniref:Endoribonuclease xendoU domain-containing protein n=1 Tax=Ditylenchus destructor TaxID=166010 RepID=A0AAD4MHX8_9BILA|nr:endoribonuclease xendoU domain-containing protein [Ditylenchus destructor]